MLSIRGAFGSVLSTTKTIMTKGETQNEQQATEATRKTRMVQNIQNKKEMNCHGGRGDGSSAHLRV